MDKFTLLTTKQCFGLDVLNIKKLSVFEKRGTKAAMTDLSILLGGSVWDQKFYQDIFDIKNRTGWYFTKDVDKWIDSIVYGVDSSGDRYDFSMTGAKGGVRLTTKYSDIKNSVLTQNIAQDGVKEIEYGEYPQSVAPQDIQSILEKEFYSKRLKKTGKTYTTPVPCNSSYFRIYDTQANEEYEYQGKRYIRMYSHNTLVTLSNGTLIDDTKAYWVEVEPIKWLVCEEQDAAVTERLLFSGMGFSTGLCGCYENSYLREFINDYFEKDIQISKNYTPYKSIPQQASNIPIYPKNQTPIVNQNNKKVDKRTNPYTFKTKEVTEEEIIKGAIESDLAVFLHGPSSEGKSARVKAIDPDCIVIYLRNATPESLNGKSAYNSETHEMIDIKPNWLKKLEAKCEAEPDKLHIVFFDEITNALPSIQGMAFNIILDKEVNGIWQLPKNARIVAAGNETKDSLSANQLSEPLFNRFVHVYIKTTTDSWLKWASEKNIHPAIYAYIASTNGKSLRTEYNGETPNADPRKWEMASKMLYKINNPEMLRGLLGEEVTKEFIEFCNRPIITLKDVLEKNYTEEEINALNSDERYVTAFGLSQVKEDNLDKVRRFVTKLGAEQTKLFDTLWVHNDEARLERLAEAKLENMQEEKIEESPIEEQESPKEKQEKKSQDKVKVKVRKK